MSVIARTFAADNPSPAVPQVGNRAARAAIWTLCFSGFGKAVTLASQIAMAWLLAPQDFGLAAMALAAMSFTAMFGGANLRNILIQRSDRFDKEAGHIFWLALLLNVAAAILLTGLAPIAGMLFKESRVVPLLLVAAIALPVQALSTVYMAALHRDLRFAPTALIQFSTSVVQNCTALFLAAKGFGPYSLILPLTVNAVFMAVTFRCAAGRIQLGWPRLECLLNLKGPALWLMANSLFIAIQSSGANIVIGLMHNSAAVAGFYYWGFSVSSQAAFLLATNLQTVLFPALNKLNGDSERQFAAVKNCCRVLTAIVAPVCLTQALLAEPLIRILFQERWAPAIPVVQWLSIGLMTQPVSLVAAAVLLARGRFRTLALTTGLIAGLVVVAAVLGAASGDQTLIARWTACGLIAGNVAAGWVAFRQFGRDGAALFATVIPPLVPGAIAGGLGLAANHLSAAYGHLVQGATVGAVCFASSLLLMRVFVPQTLTEIILRARQSIPRIPLADRMLSMMGARL